MNLLIAAQIVRQDAVTVHCSFDPGGRTYTYLAKWVGGKVDMGLLHTLKAQDRATELSLRKIQRQAMSENLLKRISMGCGEATLIEGARNGS